MKLRIIKIRNIKHSNSGDKIFIFCLWSPCQGMEIKLWQVKKNDYYYFLFLLMSTHYSALVQRQWLKSLIILMIKQWDPVLLWNKVALYCYKTHGCFFAVTVSTHKQWFGWNCFVMQCFIRSINIVFIIMIKINLSNIMKNTVKPVLSGHSKIDKTKILMTNGS